MLRKFVRSATREPSFHEAAEAVADLADVSISGRQLDRIAREVGKQLRAMWDERVERSQAGTLEPRVASRPPLAVVEVDGPGANDAAWREDKVAILAAKSHVVSGGDPEPELPACFRDRAYVEKVVGAIGGTGPKGPPAPEIRRPGPLPLPAVSGPAELRTRPRSSSRAPAARSSAPGPST